MENEFLIQNHTNKISLIKELLNKLQSDWEQKGVIQYKGDNHDLLKENKTAENSYKVIKIFGAIWGIIFFILISYIIYNEILVPFEIDISLEGYMYGVIATLIILIVLILLSGRNIKRVDKIIYDSRYFTIQLLNDKIQTEIEEPQIVNFDLNEIEIIVKHRNSKSKGYNIYINGNGKKERYIVHYDYEKKYEFIAFMIFLKSILNGRDIQYISDEEIKREYFNIGKYAKINKIKD